MSFDEIAIKVDGLSKCYQIYDKPRDRLKQFVVPRLKRALGRQPSSYFREFWALKDVSFEVKKGETVGVIGRNGSGKSTLLQLICGTLNPTYGSIQAQGRIAALLELGSGFNPEFTGRENVYMNGAVLGLSREEIDERFDEIAAFADIGGFIDQPIKTYSSGMIVRLGFSVASNVDPEILIVDEALSVGDEMFQRKCFSRIENIREAGATIFFVSHSGSQVVELCNWAMLLDEGEKIAVGRPKTMVGKYQKLIYAPDDKRAAIKNKIKEYDIPKATNGIESLRRKTFLVKTETTDVDEYFDPNLEPKSTLAYESHGAVINSPQILTLAGDPVNCLKRGNTYRYRYQVQFEKSIYKVRFGMMIKTTSGVELGGAASASTPQKGLVCVDSGTIIDVEFHFTCNLNKGVYFLNAGVTGSIENKSEIFVHRVLDLCMFRVMPVEDDISNAFIDFNCSSTIAMNF